MTNKELSNIIQDACGENTARNERIYDICFGMVLGAVTLAVAVTGCIIWEVI